MLINIPFQLLDQFFKEFQSFGQVYFCLRASAKDQGLTRAVAVLVLHFFIISTLKFSTGGIRTGVLSQMCHLGQSCLVTDDQFNLGTRPQTMDQSRPSYF